MRASLSCTLIIRLDGRDPLDDLPESEDNYRQEYAAFWRKLEAWLRAENIRPGMWPPAGWWNVKLGATFHFDDVPRVLAWLRAEGVAVTDCEEAQGETEHGDHRS